MRSDSHQTSALYINHLLTCLLTYVVTYLIHVYPGTFRCTFAGQVSRCRAPVLKELNLSLNLLTSVPANLSEFAPSLEILNLSYNEIESATLDNSYSAMTALRYLDLSRNRIHHLSDGDLDAVARGTGVPLEILSLVECALVRVDQTALAQLVNLTSLGLANNPLPQDTVTAALRSIGRRAAANWSHADDLERYAAADVDVEDQIGRRCPTSDSQLVRLDISEVILTNLTVDAVGGFSRLVVLDASYCELEHVEPHLFDCLPKLPAQFRRRGTLNSSHSLTSPFHSVACRTRPFLSVCAVLFTGRK